MYVGGNPIMYTDPTGHEGKVQGGFFGAMGEVIGKIFGGSEKPEKAAVRPPEVVNEKRKPKDITIYLDVGHGGSCGKKCDGGGGTEGYPEKDINLMNAKILKRQLEKKGYNVIMSRTTDAYLSRDHRDDIATASGADYMISIHFNNVQNDRSLLSILHDQSEEGRDSDFFVNRIREHMRGRMPEDMRLDIDWTQHFWQVDEAKIPAIIIELGNKNSRIDMRRMYSMGKRRKLLKSVAESIDETIQEMERSGVRDE